MQLWIRMPSSAEFQSTLSVGRATHALQGIRENLEYFNPHPPWGERPPPEFVLLVFIVFQSTPSARRATLILFVLRAVTLFQSTPSARRATHQYTGAQPRVDISIHALREEGDCSLLEQIITRKNISIHALREEGDSHLSGCTTRTIKFQSTPSARRATNAAQAWSQMQSISIHALREESDTVRMGKKQRRKNFNPRPPRGERLRPDA